MKTKSKLVLGLSILSAATLAAATTSTFAWFQATATQRQGFENDLTVAAQTEYGNGLKVVLSWVDAQGTALVGDALSLSGVYATDSNGVAKIFNNAGSLVELPNQNALKKAESAKLHMSFALGEDGHEVAVGSKNDLIAYAGTYKISINTATSTTKVGGTATPDAGGSRAKVSNVSASAASTSTLNAAGFTITINDTGALASVVPTDTTNAALGNWAVATGDLTADTTVYFGIDGGTATEVGTNKGNVDTAISVSLSVAKVN